jgi:hypothetical protein
MHGVGCVLHNFSASLEPPLPADLFVTPKDSLTVRTNISKHIDDVVFIPPPLYFAPPSGMFAALTDATTGLSIPPKHNFPSVDSAKIRALLIPYSPFRSSSIASLILRISNLAL